MSNSSASNLSGKVAIVTGASRGIGEALAFGLAKRGAKVIDVMYIKLSNIS